MSRFFIAAFGIGVACSVVFAQQRIPSGGPIPDVRGFNNKITDPAETSKISPNNLRTLTIAGIRVSAHPRYAMSGTS